MLLQALPMRFVLVAMDKFNPNEPRDADGKWTSGGGSKTITAFHGTNASFDKFEMGAVGGAWFSSDREHAASFGSVGQYELSFNDPIRIDGAHARFDKGGYDADGVLADVLREAAAKGHDGAIIENWEGSGEVYVALDPDQIKRIDAKPKLSENAGNKAKLISDLKAFADGDNFSGARLRELEKAGLVDEDTGWLSKKGAALLKKHGKD